jgi:hypothetical protein
MAAVGSLLLTFDSALCLPPNSNPRKIAAARLRDQFPNARIKLAGVP